MWITGKLEPHIPIQLDIPLSPLHCGRTGAETGLNRGMGNSCVHIMQTNAVRRPEKRLYGVAESIERHRNRALILGLLLPLGLGIAMPNGNAEHAYATQPQSDRQCEALCGWPVLDPRIEREFEKPAKRWLSGHRGIDLTAQAGTVIVAPQAGIIRFAGKVAEKDVVSMRHSNGVISTFEPATTTLTVGAAVTQGQFIGTVGGASDHCAGQCLHWGLKRGEDDYLDPQRYAGNQKIVLKPL